MCSLRLQIGIKKAGRFIICIVSNECFFFLLFCLSTFFVVCPSRMLPSACIFSFLFHLRHLRQRNYQKKEGEGFNHYEEAETTVPKKKAVGQSCKLPGFYDTKSRKGHAGSTHEKRNELSERNGSVRHMWQTLKVLTAHRWRRLDNQCVKHSGEKIRKWNSESVGFHRRRWSEDEESDGEGLTLKVTGP